MHPVVASKGNLEFIDRVAGSEGPEKVEIGSQEERQLSSSFSKDSLYRQYFRTFQAQTESE